MGDPEENPIEMSTNPQDENGNTTSDGNNHNNQYNSSLRRGKQGERGNTRSNTRINISKHGKHEHYK